MRLLLLISALAIATPVAGQAHPFDRFIGSYEVIESSLPAPNAEITFQSVAAGKGMRSVWRHGEGESFYEAQALWGYDAETDQVRVFEVNSAGVVGLDVGDFDESGTLTLRRFAADAETVLERRVFKWSHPDTLDMSLVFIQPNDTTRQSVTIARK